MNYKSTTDLLVACAVARGINAAQLSPADPEVVLLEWQGHTEPIYYSNTDKLGKVKERIMENKILTTAFLARGGFPVPREIIATTEADAQAFLAEHGRIVTKPLLLSQGKGVTVDIQDSEQLRQAFEYAQEAGRTGSIPNEQVVCQVYVTGRDFRLIVIDARHVFIAERIPAHVIGDGVHTIQELVAKKNVPRPHNRQIPISQSVLNLLREQGFDQTSIPVKEQHVLLAKIANTHAGGSIHDITASVPEAVKEQARAVAQYCGLPIVGIDCLVEDITQGLGTIIELNVTPDLRYTPNDTLTQTLGNLIIDMLFPETVK